MYFITGIRNIKKDKGSWIDFNSHCFGYEETKQDAIGDLEKIYQDGYEYLVIEEFGPGVQSFSKEEMWFEYNEGEYNAIDKPQEFKNIDGIIADVCNFAMG